MADKHTWLYPWSKSRQINLYPTDVTKGMTYRMRQGKVTPISVAIAPHNMPPPAAPGSDPDTRIRITDEQARALADQGNIPGRQFAVQEPQPTAAQTYGDKFTQFVVDAAQKTSEIAQKAPKEIYRAWLASGDVTGHVGPQQDLDKVVEETYPQVEDFIHDALSYAKQFISKAINMGATYGALGHSAITGDWSAFEPAKEPLLKIGDFVISEPKFFAEPDEQGRWERGQGPKPEEVKSSFVQDALDKKAGIGMVALGLGEDLLVDPMMLVGGVNKIPEVEKIFKILQIKNLERNLAEPLTKMLTIGNKINVRAAKGLETTKLVEQFNEWAGVLSERKVAALKKGVITEEQSGLIDSYLAHVKDKVGPREVAEAPIPGTTKAGPKSPKTVRPEEAASEYQAQALQDGVYDNKSERAQRIYEQNIPEDYKGEYPTPERTYNKFDLTPPGMPKENPESKYPWELTERQYVENMAGKPIKDVTFSEHAKYKAQYDDLKDKYVGPIITDEDIQNARRLQTTKRVGGKIREEGAWAEHPADKSAHEQRIYDEFLPEGYEAFPTHAAGTPDEPIPHNEHEHHEAAKSLITRIGDTVRAAREKPVRDVASDSWRAFKSYFTSSIAALPHDSWLEAKLLQGANQKFASAFRNGVRDWKIDADTGKAVATFDQRPQLSYILDPVAGKSVLFDGEEWRLEDLAAERAWMNQVRTAIEGNRPNTGVSVAGLKKWEAEFAKLDPETQRALDISANRIHDFGNWILDRAVELRQIAPADAARMREVNPFYVPLKRALAGNIVKDPNKLRPSGMGFLKIRKGGKQKTLNPLSSLIDNAFFGGMSMDASHMRRTAINEILSNDKTKDLVELVKVTEARQPTAEERAVDNSIRKTAKEIDLENQKIMLEMGKDPKDPENAGLADSVKEYQEYFHRPTESSKDVIWFRDVDNGKSVTKFYRVKDKVLLNALQTNPDVVGLGFNWLDRAARGLKQVVTTATTANPAFIARNITRDVIHAVIVNPELTFNHPVTGAVDIARAIKGSPGALKDIITEGPFYSALMWNGAGGSELYARREKLAYDLMVRQMRKAGKGDNVLNVLFPSKNPFTIMNRWGSITEQLPRYLAAEDVFRKTGDIKQAALAFRQATVDFADAGTVTRAWGRYVPFLQASVAGVSQTAGFLNPRTAQGHSNIVKAFAALTVPTYLLWLHNHDEEWYKKLEPYERDQYLYVTEHFRIPKPQELGTIFSSVPEVTLNKLFHVDPAGTMKELKALFEAIRINVSPTLFAVPVGIVANKDFFADKPIDKKALEGISTPSLRADFSTSPTMRLLAQKFPAMFDKTGIKPNQVDYLINSIGSNTGRDVLKGTDLLAKWAMNREGQPQTPATIRDIPFAGGFGFIPNTDKNSNSYLSYYYDNAKTDEAKITDANLADRSLPEQNQEYYIKRAGPGATYQLRRGMAFTDTIDELSQQYKYVANNKQPPDNDSADTMEGVSIILGREVKTFQQIVPEEKKKVMDTLRGLIGQWTEAYYNDRERSLRAMKEGYKIKRIVERK